MNFLAKIFSRNHEGHFIQLIRYAISGAAGTIVHSCIFIGLGLFMLPALTQDDVVVKLLSAGIQPVSETIRARNSMLNNIIAFLFSNGMVYLLNIFWVFESGKHHRVKEVFLFYAVTAAGLAIGTVSMGILIKYFQVHTSLAFVANFIVIWFINYLLRKFYIFRR